jgi:hypothetical protein
MVKHASEPTERNLAENIVKVLQLKFGFSENFDFAYDLSAVKDMFLLSESACLRVCVLSFFLFL